jgi:hypothetical protein
MIIHKLVNKSLYNLQVAQVRERNPEFRKKKEGMKVKEHGSKLWFPFFPLFYIYYLYNLSP